MNIGYACQLIGIQNTDFSTCQMKTVNDEKLRTVIKHNLESLKNIMEYNTTEGIKLFRVTSDLIPFGSSPVNTLNWDEIFFEDFGLLREMIQKNGIRISVHPGQYTVLNSPNPDVVERAVLDLDYHVKVLELLGGTQNNKMILHIGGAYGDKKSAIRRFIENYKKLDDRIKTHLIIENDDKIYNVEEVMEISEHAKIPVVFDVLHHEINKTKDSPDAFYWIRETGKTWKPEDGIQKIHYSEQNPCKQPGAHSEFITAETFVSFKIHLEEEFEKYSYSGSLPDIMLEVKDKNLSAIKCSNLIAQNHEIVKLEREWGKYKYYVLEKSHQDYLKIRSLLNDKTKYPVQEFYETLERVRFFEAKTAGKVNTADHIWGYFKKDALPEEKKKYEMLKNKLKASEKENRAMKNFLLKMAVKYKKEYLLHSLYFFLE